MFLYHQPKKVRFFEIGNSVQYCFALKQDYKIIKKFSLKNLNNIPGDRRRNKKKIRKYSKYDCFCLSNSK